MRVYNLAHDLAIHGSFFESQLRRYKKAFSSTSLIVILQSPTTGICTMQFASSDVQFGDERGCVLCTA